MRKTLKLCLEFCCHRRWAHERKAARLSFSLLRAVSITLRGGVSNDDENCDGGLSSLGGRLLPFYREIHPLERMDMP